MTSKDSYIMFDIAIFAILNMTVSIHKVKPSLYFQQEHIHKIVSGIILFLIVVSENRFVKKV